MTKPKHPNVKCAIGTLSNKGTGAKHYSPARADLSDVQIPHRNSSMPSGSYVPQDRTVYRPGSVDAARPRVRSV